VWESKTKTDLILEVWEKLDCESIGKQELLAIREVVSDIFGNGAVDSPMHLARFLADEGAQLRHSEIMELHIESFEDPLDNPLFRNIYKFEDFKQAYNSIRQLENLRKKLSADNDKEALRLLQKNTLEEKKELLKSNNIKSREIASWVTIWLQNPDIFEMWAELRQNSQEFKERFGE
jgi:hypothetical protein